MPDTYDVLKRIQDPINTEQEETTLGREFHGIQSQSIEYGIMEKAEDIYILLDAFGWDDVGSWIALERIKTPNEFGNMVNKIL